MSEDPCVGTAGIPQRKLSKESAGGGGTSEDDCEGRGAGEDSLARKDRTPRTGRAASGDTARATERMSEQKNRKKDKRRTSGRTYRDTLRAGPNTQSAGTRGTRDEAALLLLLPATLALGNNVKPKGKGEEQKKLTRADLAVSGAAEGVGAAGAAGAARRERTEREPPVGGRGTDGEGAEPGVEGGAGPAPDPVEGEREEAGRTAGEGICAGERAAGEQEEVRVGGTRTGAGPRELDEVSTESAGVDARRAEGVATGCVTTTGGTGGGATSTGAGTNGGNLSGYASASVIPSGNCATISRITCPPTTQGMSSAQSRVANLTKALWASSLKACSSVSRETSDPRGDCSRRS